MNKLLFKNPVFLPDEMLNFTVRLGEKWKNNSSIGDIVDIQIDDDENTRPGVITKIYACKLGDIPDEVYDYEHDLNCHTWAGLVHAMKRAYPELKDCAHSELRKLTVTCIGFIFNEEESESNN